MDSTIYETFEQVDDTHWWFVGRRAIVHDVIARYLTPTTSRRRVLDAGCGTGGNLKMLTAFGDVTGLELDPSAARAARQRIGSNGTVLDGGLPEGLPVGQTFDLITMLDVLEHLDDPVGTLTAMRESLAPAATFVITVPAFQFLWSKLDEVGHHKRRYSRALLEEHLVKAGLKIEFCTYFNSLLFGPIAAVRLFRNVFPGDEKVIDYADGGKVGNWVLTRLFKAERYVAPRVPLPFGVSLLAVARRA